MKDYTTYYYRKMNDEFVKTVKENFPWLIDFVKKTPDLDFQTGNDPKSKRSWFSVYRGTGRVLTIESRSKKSEYKLTAAGAYKDIAPSGFFTSPTIDGFKKYIDAIRKSNKFSRYYESDNGKKEGYYQNLIGRRYSFETQGEDNFIIIDKEMVVGFKDEGVKKEWNKEIIKQQKSLIEKLKSTYKGRLPKEIKSEYGEFDFLAMTWDGDIIIMELKQDDPTKTYLSPIQVRYYYEQFQKLMSEDKKLSDNILQMVIQKVNLGIINIPKGKILPQKLSGNVLTCVIVGEEGGLSETICERFRFIRDIFLPKMKAFSCKQDGTLIPWL
jgi:hypothetical protein